MWRMTWYCIDDNTVWEMTVDESYRNWEHWRSFVAQPTWGIYEGLRRTGKTTREGVAVVTADRRPQLSEPMEDQDSAHDLIRECNRYHEAPAV